MKIGFDMDGVLYPFERCFHAWMKQQDPEGAELGRYDAPATKWSFYEDWGMSLDEFKREMADAAVYGHLYWSQEPYVGALALLGWCRNYGHTIHLVTHRAEQGSVTNTEQWLEKEKIPYTTLTFAHDKSIIDADVLIEDRPENLQAWFDATGKPGIMFTRPWNEGWNPDGATSYWRVATYDQLRHVLQHLSSCQADVDQGSPTQKGFSREETILEEAQRLVFGDRQADYGHPIDDFTKTAGMWSAAFGWDVGPEDIPLAMIMVKISREKNRAKRDNAVDIAGYAGTLAMVRERQEQG